MCTRFHVPVRVCGVALECVNTCARRHVYAHARAHAHRRAHTSIQTTYVRGTKGCLRVFTHHHRTHITHITSHIGVNSDTEASLGIVYA